jgi:eukaryotic-like serine/threonine-protein kinase
MIGMRLCEGRYQLERLLGRGGMASVWLARDEVLERQVAVKLLSDVMASDPEYLARFRREARVAARLSHPNLVRIFDFAGGERPYLVMEYVPGGDLAEHLSRGEPVDVERLARGLLSAVAHIHAAGVLHRDIKPQNLLISPDGAARLTDFGIALPEDATALTRTGHLLGTARYIAPEVMTGEPASQRSDLYSCGVLLGDCLAAGSPLRLRALIGRLRAANPGRRPRSATEGLSWLVQHTAFPDPETEAAKARPPIARPSAAAPPGHDERGATTARVSGGREPPADPSPSRIGTAIDLRKWGAAVLAAALAATLAATLIDRSGGEKPDGPPSEARVADAGAEDPRDGDADTEHRDGRATVPLPRGNSPEFGAELNQQGFELIQEGRHEEAIPVLENAVQSFPRGTDDLNYAYALFNLGNALRLAGRPEAAIPVLARRLRIPNQTSVVRAELAAAREATGD